MRMVRVFDSALHVLHGPGVGAVQAVGEAEQGTEPANGVPVSCIEIGEGLVLELRLGLAVIASDLGDDLALPGRQAPQVPVDDQMITMAMMLFVIDDRADLVQPGGQLERMRSCAGKLQGSCS